MMILTCPSCATRFFVEDEAIGASGRRVKCDSCGNVWSSGGVAVKHPAETPAAFESAPAFWEAPADRTVIGRAELSNAAPLFVERPKPADQMASGRRRGLLPFVLLLVALSIVFGLLIFRPQIERTFPGSVAAYRAVGMDTDRPRE